MIGSICPTCAPLSLDAWAFLFVLTLLGAVALLVSGLRKP
jgi:hypothetical protein